MWYVGQTLYDKENQEVVGYLGFDEENNHLCVNAKGELGSIDDIDKFTEFYTGDNKIQVGNFGEVIEDILEGGVFCGGIDVNKFAVLKQECINYLTRVEVSVNTNGSFAMSGS